MAEQSILSRVLTDCVGVILFAAGSVMSGHVAAEPFKPTDWSVFEQDTTPSHMADVEVGSSDSAQRVRVPVMIRAFEKTPMVTSGSAAKDSRSVMIPRKPVFLNLKARLDRANHFYFGDWHLETIPQGKTAEGELRFKISLARTFGENHDLEEHLGDVEVRGGLSRIDAALLNFHGRRSSRFRGPGGEVVAELQVNSDNVRPQAGGLDRVSRLNPTGVGPNTQVK